MIEQRATAAGLRERIDAITPQDAGRVRLVLPAVAFDDWIVWLGELQAAHGALRPATPAGRGPHPAA